MLMCIRRLLETACRFASASQANTAITFVLLTIPIVYGVGAAVDYSRANAVKAAMQSAADATALKAAKTWSAESATALQQSSSAWFNGVVDKRKVTNAAVGATADSASKSVTVTATGSVSTDSLGVMGIAQIPVSVTSTASWGMTKLQVALVLDNTGSMAQNGKIAALRAASHQLLRQLKSAAANPGDVQVAIIPFTTDVNVGKSNVSAAWLKWSYTALSPLGYGNTSISTVTVGQSTWTGCVTDRDQSYDVSNTAASAANVATLFPADNPLLGCPPQIMPLSYSWSALNSLIDQMTPLGETNLTMGLVWGWQALTTGSPLNAPVPSADTSQVMIFMTDGVNTANRWTNVLFGSGTSAQIDARTQAVCQNIKTTGITVYTVQVDTSGESPPSALLQNCASSLSKWFYLKNAGELVTTFQQIGTTLSNLRIAR